MRAYDMKSILDCCVTGINLIKDAYNGVIPMDAEKWAIVDEHLRMIASELNEFTTHPGDDDDR